MTYYHDHGHEPVVETRREVVEPGSSITSYALVKYAFILGITIVILWFIARYLLPMFAG